VTATLAVLFAAVLLGLSFATDVVGLTAGSVGIRLAGQGALGLAATTAVAVHVTHRRGLALGITSAVGRRVHRLRAPAAGCGTRPHRQLHPPVVLAAAALPLATAVAAVLAPAPPTTPAGTRQEAGRAVAGWLRADGRTRPTSPQRRSRCVDDVRDRTSAVPGRRPALLNPTIGRT